MEGENEYETINTNNVYVHLGAGGAAGMMEHCVMYPVDCIKTRMQSMNAATSSHYRSLVQSFRWVITTEGLFRPMRGVQVVAAGAGPAHALYFATYEKFKEILEGGKDAQTALTTGAAGVMATLVHDGFMNPFEVVKQRMQMENSQFTSAWKCFKSIYAAEGIKAFYRSYTTQLGMNVPYQSLHFIVYEHLSEKLNPKGEYNPLTHIISGGGAGAVAAACTTPLDVVKTLLNTQEAVSGGVKAEGIRDAIGIIYKARGMPGFIQGLSARVMFHAPSAAICWSVYEFFKNFLSTNQMRGSADAMETVKLPELSSQKNPSGKVEFAEAR
eukprot:Colp12_sorted_trinity150504_noHs@5788